MGVALYKGRSVTEDGIHAGWFERFANTYRAELKAFLAAVRGELPVHASLADGLRAQVVAEASIESMTRGCPVSLQRQW
jgi:myo-inositol 2-dehydrogenase/D-chiro-inositol 1-dehydrogenase